MLRPSTTAEEIGIDRKRSMIPRCASLTTAAIVAPIPNAIVWANIPGIRNAR